MTGEPIAPEDFHYRRVGRWFAQVAHALREPASDELRELGAEKTGLTGGGVHFHADARVAYRIALSSRLVSRVLAPLVIFDCHSDRYLYRTAQRIDWSAFLPVTGTLAVVANVANSRIRHSQYAAQVLKDAIVDQFREETGARPSVDRHGADLVLNLHIADDRATIAVDLGGEALHRRGYRTEGGEAPLSETTAAAIVRYAEWDGGTPLLDPMCGGGTLLAEALMAAGRVPAGWLRTRWGLERLPDFDRSLWKSVRAEAGGRVRPVPAGTIAGNDASDEAVHRAKDALARLPGGGGVTVTTGPFAAIRPPAGATILANPPWGVRLGRPDEAHVLAKELGDWLKRRGGGCTAWIYFGERELVKSLGLKTSRKIPLRAGGLDGRLVRVDLW